MALDTSRHLHLPNEILANIFVNLSKADLKPLRLVCQLWSALTTPVLFSRIYISSRFKDIEVFRRWINNEGCRLAVRELVYDLSTLVPVADKVQYCHRLLRQLQASKLSIGLDCDDSDEINQLLDVAQHEQLPRRCEEELRRALDYQIVNEGFKAYSRETWLQGANRKNLKAVNALTYGLQSLPGLKSVVLTDDYNYQACPEAKFNALTPNPLTHVGTPFARCWNPMYLKPVRWSSTPGTWVEYKNYCREYIMVVRTIFLHSMVEEISILPSSITKAPFPVTYALPSPSNSPEDPMIFLTLRSLHLAVRFGFREQIEPALECLKSCLTAIPYLKTLRLEFEETSSNIQRCHFDRVFGSPPQFWPQLRKFALWGLSARSGEFQEFLSRHPIQDLELERIRLTDGDWATMIDGMRSLLPKLEKVKFDRFFMDDRGQLVNKQTRTGTLLSAIERYLLKGGQNPLRTAG